MADINNIRFQFNHEGLNISEISQKTGHDPKTIRKYLDQEDFNVTPVPTSSRCTKLDPFTGLIDSWLEADRKVKRKQRHTATRVFQRLVKECPGFDASYRTVANYFKARRKELFKSGGFLPLEHPPGEAQVDFGKTEYGEPIFQQTPKTLSQQNAISKTFNHISKNPGLLRFFPYIKFIV